MTSLTHTLLSYGKGVADVGGAEASVATSGETVYQACQALAAKLQLSSPPSSSSSSSSSLSSFNLAVAVTDGPYPARLIPLMVDGQATLFHDNTQDGQPVPASIQDNTREGGGGGVVATVTTFTLTRPLPRPLVNPIGAGDAVASGTLLPHPLSLTSPSLSHHPLSHTFPLSHMYPTLSPLSYSLFLLHVTFLSLIFSPSLTHHSLSRMYPTPLSYSPLLSHIRSLFHVYPPLFVSPITPSLNEPPNTYPLSSPHLPPRLI